MTDDLVKRPDDEQDDLTIVYMWTYKMVEIKKLKDRIEQLETALQGLFDNFLELHAKEGCDCDDCEAVRFARAALGEKKDG